MNREDPDFAQLRRLLKLKRYEQPPPRYFNDFSFQVVARLRAAQASSAGQSWWQRLWTSMELRPAFPVALSAAVCALLVVGAVYTEMPQVPEVLIPTPASHRVDDEKPAIDMAAIAMMGQGRRADVSLSSTNPVSAPDSLFNRVPAYETWRAGHPMFR